MLDFDGLSEDVARALLTRALGKAPSPADELVAALSSPRRDVSFHDLQHAGVLPLCPHSEELLAMGHASLDALNALKNTAKKRIKSATTPTARMAATLLYLLAVAAALVHRNKYISSQDKKPLAKIYLRLADVTPSPWKTLFRCAAENLAGA
jgi:hypothetical protein